MKDNQTCKNTQISFVPCGLIVAALLSTNMWAHPLRLTPNLWRCLLLSSISSCIVDSSLSSHTLLLMDFIYWMYLVQKLNASSTTYSIDMLPYGHVWFLTYPFRAFMYHSMGYIHHVWTWPNMWSFSKRWTTKCVITLKHVGRKTFFKVHMVFATLTFSTSMLFESITYKQSLLNIWLKLVKDFHVSFYTNVRS